MSFQLTICCPVSGYPPPVVTWKKNGIELQKGENTEFTIAAVKEEQFGHYTCTATDGITSLGPFDIMVVNKVGKCVEIIFCVRYRLAIHGTHTKCLGSSLFLMMTCQLLKIPRREVLCASNHA